MSSGFKFRLQKVLTYREDSEKAAVVKFSSAQISLQESEEELTQLKQELMAVCSDLTTKDCASLDVNSRILSLRYTDYLSGCISNQKRTVQEKAADVIKERYQLEVTMKERKILSGLKDKNSTVYNQESKLTEQKLNDEFAITGFCRR
ncbi:MAG: flagellar export protein FliJ [Firmicutes bacterium]|nr:flagellar export protein FliJ [Bacillota bacterium]